ncbi:hypothetical protein [Parachlamydia sp. AcF125]|nr:hypothetical protein [Parachlamydia sp. AcF125]MBS4168918.1 hypothetical protein [Parachlamydia sp. AcF125]
MLKEKSYLIAKEAASYIGQNFPKVVDEALGLFEEAKNTLEKFQLIE